MTAFAVGDRVRLKRGHRIKPRGQDHRPGNEGVIIDLMDTPGHALIRFTSRRKGRTGQGSKSVELLSKFEKVANAADELRQQIRQAAMENAGFRMRPDGTYFKGGN